MSIYQYKARDEEGRLISGRMDVAGEKELEKRLKNSGFFLVKFSLEKRSLLSKNIVREFLPVTLRDLYALTLQLANTISTGVPLLVSLCSIAEGCKNKKLETVLEKVTEDLRSGSPLSEALGKHPYVFSKFYTNMVKLGEASGTLPKILYGLAEYIKKEMEIKRRIVYAITYPVVLASIGTGLVIYVLTYIIPQFIQIFSEQKIPLPLPTLILLILSNLLVKYWYLFLLVLAGLVVSFRLFVLSDYTRLVIDRLKLRIPVIGEVLRKICAKRFIDGLYLLYTSGLPILEALNIVKSILRNRHFEKIIDILWAHISQGEDLTSYLGLNELFPPDIVAMIRSGEESGTLQKMLEKISLIYQDEVNYSIEGLISAFEIGVILVMGIGVGFVAMAILFPMFKLSQGIMGT